MKNKAIYDIKDKKVLIDYKDEVVELTKSKQDRINTFWDEQIKEKPYFFRGDLVTAIDLKEDEENKLILKCRKTDYAHFWYEKNHPNEKASSCSVWAGTLLETLDGYYVLGRMASKTAAPGRINVSGGSIDFDLDKENGKICPEKTAIRELEEEMGINANNPKYVRNKEIKYIKIPNSEISSVGFIMKADLNMNVEGFKKLNEDFRKKLKENGAIEEFQDILFVKADEKSLGEFFEENKGNMYRYLQELIEKDQRERDNKELEER